MKKNFILLIVILACLSAILVNSCKKESVNPPPVVTPITTSFIEEFDTVYKLTLKGWAIKDNSGSSVSAAWSQGNAGTVDKSGIAYGFPAYSYKLSKDEFIYSYLYNSGNAVSSWIISPVLGVKNGDKISFYTRADSAFINGDRMQVLMNSSAPSSADVGNSLQSAGSFTIILFDINPGETPAGYPRTWTKYEYVFSNLSGTTNTRIAFRHLGAGRSQLKGVGVDLFKFEVL